MEPLKIQNLFFTTLHKILPFCQKMTTGPISCTGFFETLVKKIVFSMVPLYFRPILATFNMNNIFLSEVPFSRYVAKK